MVVFLYHLWFLLLVVISDWINWKDPHVSLFGWLCWDTFSLYDVLWINIIIIRYLIRKASVLKDLQDYFDENLSVGMEIFNQTFACNLYWKLKSRQQSFQKSFFKTAFTFHWISIWLKIIPSLRQIPWKLIKFKLQKRIVWVKCNLPPTPTSPITKRNKICAFIFQ